MAGGDFSSRGRPEGPRQGVWPLWLVVLVLLAVFVVLMILLG